MAQQAKVDSTHEEYDERAPAWKRCRDVSDGQEAVHKRGTEYLPKLTDQSDQDYLAYKTRASFYNATWRTLGGLLGMMFRKEPTIELPAGVNSYLPDIDMAGMTLETFARNVALEVLEVGRVGILVDHPPRPQVGPISLAASNAIGLRPKLTIYKAETITNWRYGRVRNRWQLVQVRLKEEVCEPDGEWGETEIVQYRVLEMIEGEGGSYTYQQRLFRKDEKTKEWVQFGEPIVPTMANNALDFIPFYIAGVDGVDSEPDAPPLIDLVDLNLAHYRVTADYEHGCHFTGLPTLFLSGIRADKDGKTPTFYIGSQAAILVDDPNADGKFIEFTGQGLGALVANLDRKEQQMAILGARMLFAEKRAAEAAETASIHRTGENSVLAAIAGGVSEAMERALSVFCKWAGADGEVKYQLNRDYNPAMIDAQQLTALLKTVQMGQMSEQELFYLLQRGDMIEGNKTFEQHQEEVASTELPRPVVAPANEQTSIAA